METESCTFQGKYLCERETSLESLLEQFSSLKTSDYCLSYLFTYRDFPGGSLGLAWIASRTEGGVCHQGGGRSLNTGVVSLARNNLPVSEHVAALTLTHEIGHSFGSPHDSGSCEGGGEGGHYLMHKTGSLGLRRNNMMFSLCSSANISLVLSSPRLTCWREEETSLCGNGVVEGWEECDCGTVAQCTDQCCVPPGDPQGRQPCTLTPSASCSPSEGLCCNSSCQFVPPDLPCSPASECNRGASCTGRTAICPVPASLPDGSLCEAASRRCEGGECRASVCPSHGGRQACSPHLLTDPRAACSPHCQHQDGPCLPLPLSFRPDTECSLAGGFGHCSQAGQCQVRDSDPGPGWLVGLSIFLVVYLLASLVATYIYCNYCRARTRSI